MDRVHYSLSGMLTVSFSFFIPHVIEGLNAWPAKAVLMLQSLLLIGAGFVLYPGSVKASSRAVFIWCFALALAAVFFAWLSADRSGIEMPAMIHLGIAVFLLSIIMHGIKLLCLSVCVDSVHFDVSILAAGVTVLTIPFWMAPWGERVATVSNIGFNGLLSCSPLSYFAEILGYDYLRSGWLYEMTPYGMLRYEYPEAFGYSGVLLLVTLVLYSIVGRLKKRSNPI